MGSSPLIPSQPSRWMGRSTRLLTSSLPRGGVPSSLPTVKFLVSPMKSPRLRRGLPKQSRLWKGKGDRVQKGLCFAGASLGMTSDGFFELEELPRYGGVRPPQPPAPAPGACPRHCRFPAGAASSSGPDTSRWRSRGSSPRWAPSRPCSSATTRYCHHLSPAVTAQPNRPCWLSAPAQTQSPPTCPEFLQPHVSPVHSLELYFKSRLEKRKKRKENSEETNREVS